MQYNVAVDFAQREFISKRLPSMQQSVGPVGYESSWRLHEDLRPFVVGPLNIAIQNNGDFAYPYGYIWPDSISKTDFRRIDRVTQDEYSWRKQSLIKAPDSDFPVAILRSPYGFVDPYSIGSFLMSFVQFPQTPIWAYTLVNTIPVFNEAASVDLKVPEISSNEITMIILAHLGINLSSEELVQYGLTRQASGT